MGIMQMSKKNITPCSNYMHMGDSGVLVLFFYFYSTSHAISLLFILLLSLSVSSSLYMSFMDLPYPPPSILLFLSIRLLPQQPVKQFKVTSSQRLLGSPSLLTYFPCSTLTKHTHTELKRAMHEDTQTKIYKWIISITVNNISQWKCPHIQASSSLPFHSSIHFILNSHKLFFTLSRTQLWLTLTQYVTAGEL